MISNPSRALAIAAGVVIIALTAAAIIVLLLFLMAMNGLAIYLRNRFEKTW